jgi:hypothetical protein
LPKKEEGLFVKPRICIQYGCFYTELGDAIPAAARFGPGVQSAVRVKQ